MKKLPLKAYIWDIETLKKWMVNGWLTQKNKYIFFLLLSCTTILFTSPSESYMSLPFFWIFLRKYTPVILLGITIMAAYIINGREKGKDFIARFVIIDWIISMRICIFLTIPMLIVYYFLYKHLPYHLWLKTRIVIGLLIEIFAYWRICYNIRDIRRRELELTHLQSDHTNENNEARFPIDIRFS